MIKYLNRLSKYEFMVLINFLRKLGIFRFGMKKGKYTNGKNRPTEFQMNSVYDEKKDLISSKK